MFNSLKKHKVYNSDRSPPLKTSLQSIANHFFYKFKPFKVFSPIIHKSDINILKDLSKDSNISICRPDKGNGVVIMNKNDYINKVQTILQDQTKFKIIDNIDPLVYTLRLEDRINKTLNKFNKLGVINDSTKRELSASGTHPGILYGLPKIHKPNTPIRPILSAIGTSTYNISKYLVNLLSHLTDSPYKIRNSYDFTQFITNFTNANQYIMASFDITSLFTNIPIDETNEIIMGKLFPHAQSCFNGYNREQFHSLLKLATKNTNFFFNNNLYEQIDGVGMGQPCAPTLSDIFLSFHEQTWLQNCPIDIKPAVYKRYVDDTFLLFKNISQIDRFLNYLNSQHPNIKFTKELEQDRSLPFLDIKITMNDNRFITEVYRKPTFTGLGTSYFSNDNLIFKVNAIKTMLFRAFNISSSYTLFHNEVTFLKDFFHNNGFPTFLFQKYLKSFLNSIFNPKPVHLIAPKLKMYIPIPYIGYLTEKMKTEIMKILQVRFPQLNINLISSNKNSISNIFKHKEQLPVPMCSNIIYQYECQICKDLYIGSTIRHFQCRISEHLGISPRTKAQLSAPLFSSIREHRDQTNHRISLDQFKIIDRTSNNVRLLESLYIFKMKPKLNSGLPVDLEMVV